MVCSIIVTHIQIIFYVVYRPPVLPQNGLNISEFIEEWTQFISQHALNKEELIIVGDINIHLDNIALRTTCRFTDSLDICDFHQQITEPNTQQVIP